MKKNDAPLILAAIRLILLHRDFIKKFTIFLHQYFPVSGRHLKIKRTQHKNTDGFLNCHSLFLLSFFQKQKKIHTVCYYSLWTIYTYYVSQKRESCKRLGQIAVKQNSYHKMKQGLSLNSINPCLESALCNLQNISSRRSLSRQPWQEQLLRSSFQGRQ